MIDFDPTWALTKAGNAHSTVADAYGELSWPSHDNLPTPAAGQPYGRVLLLECQPAQLPAAELVLIRWRPGQRCAIHDHGGGHGFVYVLQGEVHNEAWPDSESLTSGVPGQKTSWSAGSSIPIGSQCVHSMMARADGPTISLHLYIGASTAMTIYDPESMRRFLVSNNHGAWLPDDSEILEELSWTKK
ncbi:MAG: cysteine dioxygenase family protein [Kofleriaceae bacterium]|nr:cysteine dioxygenase family protein [Kofleriaceae bacterium]